MTDLSNRIRQAVEKSGKTQRQIADAIEITEVSMSRYVNGERVPRATIMPKLAEACGVSVEWLQTGKEPYTAHVEMIIDYVTDGTDYQYCDNHGILIRCMDCEHWRRQTNYQGSPLSFGFCDSDDMWRSLYGETYEISHIDTDEDFYCGYAKGKADE